MVKVSQGVFFTPTVRQTTNKSPKYTVPLGRKSRFYFIKCLKVGLVIRFLAKRVKHLTLPHTHDILYKTGGGWL